MKKGYIITLVVVVLSIAAIVVINKISVEKKMASLYTEVIEGDFEVAISTSGDLRAENSVDIVGPEIAQRGEMRAADLRIQDIVPEGTMVKKGDYVAQLDRSNFENTLKDILDRLDELNKNLEVKLLDTAVQLAAYRDDLINQKVIVEQDSITLRNSEFEPPMTIREAEINYDQSKRTYGQKLRKYHMNVEYAKFQIEVQRRNLGRFTRRKNDYAEVLASFTITAPDQGMVIYKKDWRGNKRKAGSQITSFDRVVASIPDMRSMLSRIYISEIDISKIKTGQYSTISVDAFPKKSYKGSVYKVSNIGDKLPNSDSKVFEVLIKIDETDAELRPSMTTSNKVVLNTFSNVTFVPIECVHAEEDSIPFVFTKKGTKQIVLLGATNDKYTIIEKGLKRGESVYISTPEKPEDFKIAGNELIPVIKERDRLKKFENEKYKVNSNQSEEGKVLSMQTSIPDHK